MNQNGNGSNRPDASATERYLVISTDAHDGPPYQLHKLQPFLEARHHEAYRALNDGDERMTDAPFHREVDDPYRAFFKGWGMDDEWIGETTARYWKSVPPLDQAGRLREVERCGIVAEVLFSAPPAVEDAELRRATEDAHFRWLTDYSNGAPGRFACIVAPDWRDRDRALATIRSARRAGLFGGVASPDPNHLTNMAAGLTHALADPHWDPVWDLCAELKLPIISHACAAPDRMAAYPERSRLGMLLLEVPVFSIRPFWLLMAAGVFDRHPDLKICFIEQEVGLIPGLLETFDRQAGMYSASSLSRALKLKPSEYWHRHCFVGTPFIDPAAAARRHGIGVGNLMWGGDYPHPEGSWPYVLPALRYGLGGLPRDEIAAIVGGNALKVWDFDEPRLRKLADAIGPTVADLAEPLPRAEIPPYATGQVFGAPRRLAEPA